MDVFIFSINIAIIVSFITKKNVVLQNHIYNFFEKKVLIDYLDLPRKKNMKN